MSSLCVCVLQVLELLLSMCSVSGLRTLLCNVVFKPASAKLKAGSRRQVAGRKEESGLALVQWLSSPVEGTESCSLQALHLLHELLKVLPKLLGWVIKMWYRKRLCRFNLWNHSLKKLPLCWRQVVPLLVVCLWLLFGVCCDPVRSLWVQPVFQIVSSALWKCCFLSCCRCWRALQQRVTLTWGNTVNVSHTSLVYCSISFPDRTPPVFSSFSYALCFCDPAGTSALTPPLLCTDDSTRSMVSCHISAQLCLSQVESLLSCSCSSSPLTSVPAGSDDSLRWVTLRNVAGVYFV